MKALFTAVTLTFLTFGTANAAEEFLGPWAASETEVLKITKDGDALRAEFIRENVKYEFEKVGFPATYENGALVIKGEQGNITAKYDDVKKMLVIGGLKAFQKVSAEQAAAIIAQLEKK